jgi:ribose transport system permease protein
MGRDARAGNLDLGKYSIFIVTIIAMLFLSLTRPNFFRYSNLYSLMFGISMEFLLIIGMTFLLIMGEIDLSIGSVFAFAGVFTGYLTVKADLPVIVAVFLCLCVCAAIGYFNGFLVVRFRANSLMITIGTMILFRGVTDEIINFLKGVTYPYAYRAIVNFKIASINITIILMVIVVVVLEYLLANHASFKKLFYIGENLFSARLYGIKVERIKHTMFVITSATAGLAGIFAASRSGQTVWNTGQGLEFKMITAAILGGASLFGGKGSIVKSLFGLLLLAVILNGLVMYNIDPVWTDVVIGIVLIVAIFFDTRINREKLEF